MPHLGEEESLNIAVLTRTQNRPLLLRRALYGLLNQQTVPDEWIVVIDGGDPREVKILANLAEDAGISTKLIVNDFAKGMEAASNQGLEVVESEYFLIHDDDDSLEPKYISKVLKYFRDYPEKAAVVTLHNLIIEEVVDGEIKRLNLSPSKKPNLEFNRLLIENQWPPISMVVATAIAKEIGGFDESLPVLGDWDFNLKLSHKHKLGSIDEWLSNYHHRPDLGGPNSNTVVAKKDLHARFRSIVRSRYLQDL